MKQGDPAEATRNKSRLRRASPFADFELRVGRWRVFYRLDRQDVLVTLIGEKQGSSLMVAGEELEL